ncbi:MAG: class I SAM-dependent methyltransferase [Candidatus Staskawiczbacteria bacterium]|nr:class I SAM-dependent methyltransferase [Candidatus Staskawiczbacteria bacterium]
MKKLVKAIPEPIKSALRPFYFWANRRLRNLVTAKKSRAELERYWRDPMDHNAPNSYIEPVQRSEFLLKFFKKYADSQDKILEIGCNVGRNLNYLFVAGYKNLRGIEISKEAVELMKRVYPKILSSVKVDINSVENAVKTIENDSFDVVFTMAVFQHIHPDSEFVFSEVARITKKYLIIIEDEDGVTWRHFPRRYKKIFENLGMRQIEQFNCKEIADFGRNYWVRVFTK